VCGAEILKIPKSRIFALFPADSFLEIVLFFFFSKRFEKKRKKILDARYNNYYSPVRRLVLIKQAFERLLCGTIPPMARNITIPTDEKKRITLVSILLPTVYVYSNTYRPFAKREGTIKPTWWFFLYPPAPPWKHNLYAFIY